MDTIYAIILLFVIKVWIQYFNELLFAYKRRRGLRNDSEWRQSFDRFLGDDDLCYLSLLLSYLPFEERFRFECVSKKWQKVVYNTQTEISFEFGSQISDQTFALVLKKCQNITSIDGLPKNCRLETVIENCHKLHLIFSWYKREESVATIDTFFAKYSQQLKFYDIRVSEKYPSIEQRLNCCTNITQINSLSVPSFLLIANQNEILFNRLRKVIIRYDNQNSDNFMAFVRRYGKQLTSFTVFVDKDGTDMSILVNSLSQMSQLIDFQLEIFPESNITGDQLKQLALNCRHLKSLSLHLLPKHSPQMLTQIIKTINDYFKHLKRLDLYFSCYFPEEYELMSELLNKCQQLTHLTVKTSRYVITEEFFTNIANHLPKLQYISMDCRHITNNMLNELSKLATIQTIHLNT